MTIYRLIAWYNPCVKYCMQLNACHCLYEVGHCWCNGSWQLIYEQFGQGGWEAAKWILRHLRGTTDSTLSTLRYVDSDLAGDIDSCRKSTTGNVDQRLTKETLILQGMLTKRRLPLRSWSSLCSASIGLRAWRQRRELLQRSLCYGYT